MPKSLKIIFAGTPEFATGALRALLGTEHDVVAVYTQPDRPAGRGRKMQLSPVKQLALEKNLVIRQPKTLKEAEVQQELADLDADLMVVVAYGLLLPQAVLDIPRLGCLNIHASVLPRWRGAAPIQRAILAGDQETGITIMQMETGLDTGPMLRVAKTPIHETEQASSLHDRLAEIGAQTLLQVLSDLSHGWLKGEPQDDSLATYAHKLDKEEAKIDWRQSAQQIDRQVRAFNPWPVAYCHYGDKIMRIWNSEVCDQTVSAPPGQIVSSGKKFIDVATGEGLLRITKLQLPGKRAMSAGDFLNAHDVNCVVLT
jgi:methionyl-tRNA formyltransferase